MPNRISALVRQATMHLYPNQLGACTTAVAGRQNPTQLQRTEVAPLVALVLQVERSTCRSIGVLPLDEDRDGCPRVRHKKVPRQCGRSRTAGRND
jgi:hypothetical protein